MLSSYFSDSTQVILFQKHDTDTFNDPCLKGGGGGDLNRSMGRGVAGLRTVKKSIRKLH